MSKRINKFFRKNRRIKKAKCKLKGLLKDPLFCLGAFSIILFAFVCLFSGKAIKSLSSQGDFSSVNIVAAVNTPKSEDLFIDSNGKFKLESPELLLVENCSLRAATPPSTFSPQVLGSLVGSFDYEDTSKEIIEYMVEPGDNLWSISQAFNVSMNTIIWANNITSPVISVGQKLLILPVSGVMHIVEAGDTASDLAELYKTDADKIFAFNDISNEEELFIGELLIVPDGEQPGYAAAARASKPFAQLSTNNFYGNSHAFPYGQCTWWVAQNRAIPAWGNANQWLPNAMAAGYPTCAGSYCIPQFGAVVVLAGHPVYGHVGYVEQVKGDKVVFSEMNYIGWGKMNYRTLQIGSPSIKGYIY